MLTVTPRANTYNIGQSAVHAKQQSGVHVKERGGNTGQCDVIIEHRCLT